MTRHMISLKNVGKTFAGSSEPAVKDLSLEIEEGHVVVLVGPSGCGKTTTMKMINRLIEPTAGRIEVNGSDVLDQDPVLLRRNIGYVIQNVGLMPHRTVAQNIATVPKLCGWDDDRISTRTRELVGMLDLDPDLLHRYPSELSGGQRQRVGVARALATDPPVMLMDEPFGAVDPIVRERLQDQFLSIQEEIHKTIVFVTHDIDEAIKMADEIVILNRGGVIEQFAAPEDILRSPANEFVERFVGKERGLKRLSLMKVADLDVEPGPMVERNASVDEARAQMSAHDLDWVTVVDRGKLLGWVDPAMLEGVSSVEEVVPRPFSAYVTESSTLRHALDSIVTSRTKVAVVATDEDQYAGILSLEKITREIVS
jgi:osmoprotectant transport system ATP-binding protein